MSEIESRIPKPTSISAILPAIPKIVINRRFLYRKRFRREDFQVKFRCFQCTLQDHEVYKCFRSFTAYFCGLWESCFSVSGTFCSFQSISWSCFSGCCHWADRMAPNTPLQDFFYSLSAAFMLYDHTGDRVWDTESSFVFQSASCCFHVPSSDISPTGYGCL